MHFIPVFFNVLLLPFRNKGILALPENKHSGRAGWRAADIVSNSTKEE